MLAFKGSTSGIDLPLSVRGVFTRGVSSACTVRTVIFSNSQWQQSSRPRGCRCRASISLSGGSANVNFSSFNISFVNLRIDIDWGILSDIGLGGLLNDLTNTILDVFEPEIESALSEQIRDTVGPLLADFISDFGVATEFEVPEPVGLNLALSTGLDRIDFAGPAGTGYGQLGLYTQVYQVVAVLDCFIGTGATRWGSLTLISIEGLTRLELDSRDDLINQVLGQFGTGAV